MTQQRHLIGRTVLELNTGNLADVWSLQEEVSRLFQQQAVPEMERLFDRLIGWDEVVRLDQVVVEVGFIDRDFLADDFLRNLLSALDQILSDALQESNLQPDPLTPRLEIGISATTRPRSGADWQVLLYFLQYGRLPWWVTDGNWQEWLSRWEAGMQGDTNWQEAIRTLLRTNSVVRQRLVEQFPDSFRHPLVLQLQPTWTDWSTLLSQAQHLMQTLRLDTGTTQHLEQQAWRLLLAEVGTDQAFPAERWIRNWLRQLVVRLEPADSATGRQESVGERAEWFETIALSQRLRRAIETLPASESILWLRIIDQEGAATGTERNHLDVEMATDEEQEALSQPIHSSEVADEVTDEAVGVGRRVRSDWAVLLDFLQQGRLSGSQPSISWQEWLSRWEAGMQGDTNWQEAIRTLLRTDSVVRQRLVEQFPDSFRHQLVLQLQPFWIAWYELLDESRQISQRLNLGNDAVRFLEMQAWLLILAEIGTGSEPLPTTTWIGNWMTQLMQMLSVATESVPLKQRLQAILNTMPLSEPEVWLSSLGQLRLSGSVAPVVDSQAQVETIDLKLDHSEESKFLKTGDDGVVRTERAGDRPLDQPRIPSQSTQSTLSPEEEVAGLYVTQAGLVLLHPFLRFYLEAVELVEGNTFRDELAQQTAIYLMHYLATKQTDAPEYELVLPKLLCGWQLDAPVMRGIELPEAALIEGETMLQTAINYWEVLKSTSPEGLREGFLQRQGKLTRASDGNWKLQVEQRAIDILLDRLPWGLSMVTLPWMESLLIVEWS